MSPNVHIKDLPKNVNDFMISPIVYRIRIYSVSDFGSLINMNIGHDSWDNQYLDDGMSVGWRFPAGL